MIPGHQDEVTRCLVECDVPGIRRLWRHVAPHMPLGSEVDSLVSIHMARTSMDCLNFRLRAYSHRWLTERSLPSMLPDKMKPRAERMFPVVVEGVGIAVGGMSALTKQAAPFIRGAMSDAVADCYANGDRDPVLVRSQMSVARKKSLKQLLGMIRS